MVYKPTSVGGHFSNIVSSTSCRNHPATQITTRSHPEPHMNLAETYQGRILAFTTYAHDSIRHHSHKRDKIQCHFLAGTKSPIKMKGFSTHIGHEHIYVC